MSLRIEDIAAVFEARTVSVVTPARFDQGLTYAAFLAQAKVNVDKFEQNYRTVPLTDDDIVFFRKAASLPYGPAKILALAEDWCGDVYRELPTAARIAELTGIDLRVFPRDENPDIMDQFVSNGGKSRAIPVFAFYTRDHQYITHFTERSASAHASLAAAMDVARASLHLPSDATFSNLADDQKQSFLREVIARIQPHLGQWRKDAIKEIRILLALALGIPDDR